VAFEVTPPDGSAVKILDYFCIISFAFDFFFKFFEEYQDRETF
jgi:hypothetical protein